MLFTTPDFAVFFVVVVGLHYALPTGRRWALLLAASYTFYAWWRPAYSLLILASTLVDYTAGLRMARAEGRRRTAWLLVSLVGNLGLLGYFKYSGFLRRTLAGLIDAPGLADPPALDPLLPVGISFYTFQTLSYTLDVYRGRREPERHLGYFALYVSFFPQLVAGPIERSTRLLPQLRALPAGLDEPEAVRGLRLVLWGAFQKLVIADNLALLVDPVYANPAAFGGLGLTAATVAFGFQILADFAGYSLIAIGAARVLGVRLMTNFDRPYFAQSIPEFWHRWHISLSTWFRDYLYIPLGGSRGSRVRVYRNVLVVFVVSGLWHGANWTFVVWGALHGAFYLVARAASDLRGRGEPAAPARARGLGRAWRVALTFGLVTLAWVFFRAPDVGAALDILGRLHRGWTLAEAREILARPEAWFGGGGVAALLVVDAWRGERAFDELLAGLPRAVRWAGYYLLLAAIYLAAPAREDPFIYFQF